MITLHKDGGTKVLSPESTLIPLLLAEGWVAEGDEIAADAPRRGRPPKPKEDDEKEAIE